MNSSLLLQHLLDQPKQYGKTVTLKVCVLKICSTSLVIREMQVKTAVRYYFMPSKMAVIKQTITSVGADVVKLERPCIIDMSVKWYNCFG